MDNEFVNTSPRSRRSFSRRGIIMTGAATGVASALGLTAIADRAGAASKQDMKNDAAILNNALFYEHQAIWAYSFAATKLSDTDVGKAVLALALRNQADHKNHRDTLAKVVKSFGGTPVMSKSSYDLSSYIKAGEGNIDSDVNVAKLALALEVDAAIAYAREVSKLKTPALITAGASIGTVEASHATAIRAAFKSLGVNIDYVPASFISADTRKDWVIKV
jgi:rubrerythrin